MSVRLRPSFGLCVMLSPEQVTARFKEHVALGDLPCQIGILDRQVEVSVKAAQRHFWSPFLNMLIEVDGEHTVLNGKFGPNASVWTFFLAAYAVLFLVGVAGIIGATSQLHIGQFPSALVLTAGCAALATIVWLIGQFGQRLANAQIVEIHDFVHQIFDDVQVER